jgi:hypothetical protein
MNLQTFSTSWPANLLLTHVHTTTRRREMSTCNGIRTRDPTIRTVQDRTRLRTLCDRHNCPLNENTDVYNNIVKVICLLQLPFEKKVP